MKESVYEAIATKQKPAQGHGVWPGGGARGKKTSLSAVLELASFAHEAGGWKTQVVLKSALATDRRGQETAKQCEFSDRRVNY